MSSKHILPDDVVGPSSSNSSNIYGSIHVDDFQTRLESYNGIQRSHSLGDSIASITSSVRDGIQESLNFSGNNCSIRELGGHSTISKSTFNLIKNLVGAGVLALPSGV